MTPALPSVQAVEEMVASLRVSGVTVTRASGVYPFTEIADVLQLFNAQRKEEPAQMNFAAQESGGSDGNLWVGEGPSPLTPESAIAATQRKEEGKDGM